MRTKQTPKKGYGNRYAKPPYKKARPTAAELARKPTAAEIAREEEQLAYRNKMDALKIVGYNQQASPRFVKALRGVNKDMRSDAMLHKIVGNLNRQKRDHQELIYNTVDVGEKHAEAQRYARKWAEFPRWHRVGDGQWGNPGEYEQL